MNTRKTTNLRRSSVTMRLWIACIISVAFLLCDAKAELKWENPTQEFHPDSKSEKVVAIYSFKNVGATSVTISDIKSSCGCTIAHTEKNDYAPGESGTVSAIFTIGKRAGKQQKTIIVTTNELADNKSQLVMCVFLPELVTCEPDVLYWENGGEKTQRNIKLKTRANDIHILGVKTTDDRVFAQLKSLSNGSYEIAIEPTDTSKNIKALLKIETESPAGIPRVYSIPVNIGVPIDLNKSQRPG